MTTYTIKRKLFAYPQTQQPQAPVQQPQSMQKFQKATRKKQNGFKDVAGKHMRGLFGYVTGEQYK